jgi:hypothetical protein
MFFEAFRPKTNTYVVAPNVRLPSTLPIPPHGKYHMQGPSKEGAGNGNHLPIALIFFSHLPPYLSLLFPPTPTTSTPSPNGCPLYA